MSAASEPAARHDRDALVRFAAALFAAAGMEAGKAATVADILVEADMMGHDTHGLGLAARYLDEIAAGHLATTGEPGVVSDRGACVAWDGRRLPGPWLVTKAIDLALERVGQYGMVAVAIGNAHHMACLAAYPRRVAERGLVLTMATSAPGVATVAPFGGTRGALSPAPIAAGFPTGGTPGGDPVLIDISGSITTNNMAARLAREGRRYDRPWLMDAEGNATDDPNVLTQGGTVLPAGGLDHGQKGYGWGLLSEALSQGMSGLGRAEKPAGMTNAAFIQVFDPAAFGGLDAFTRQTATITANCLASPPRAGGGKVRLPGQSGLRKREQALREGVALRAGILDSLRPWAEKLGVPMP
ncbi:Ldh family oxidoreductase [Roseomonas sp. NAR14]|uniref:Ldh family oxidoreductase n=1 Tax=Roseomonas acroporae TaxID=2937791 RepID=A0A9X1Y8S2_9PROT|nr:Ldh family oxidoreductase [Roseomonas acroporae]MCK8786229.1 Ldh family oxidoreductase [Roseomonas acroporae]